MGLGVNLGDTLDEAHCNAKLRLYPPSGDDQFPSMIDFEDHQHWFLCTSEMLIPKSNPPRWKRIAKIRFHDAAKHGFWRQR